MQLWREMQALGCSGTRRMISNGVVLRRELWRGRPSASGRRPALPKEPAARLRPAPAEGMSRHLPVPRQVAAQMPTANATGIGIREDSQAHELIASPSRGNVADPYLIRAHNPQALHEVRVLRVGMVAVRCPWATPWALSLRPHVAPEPRPMLTVDLEVFTLKQGGHAPIAIRRPRLGQTHNGGLQRCFSAGSRSAIVTAASILQYTAILTHRITERSLEVERQYDSGKNRISQNRASKMMRSQS
jgi:hypothetical protein